MKGIDSLVAAIMVIAITIAAIVIVLEVGGPAMDRAKEDLLLQEGKNNLKLIDNFIQQVSFQGTGATGVLPLDLTGGHYEIDNSTDKITFTMDTKQQIVGVGVTDKEDNLNIEGENGKIVVTLYLNNIDLTGYGGFSKGSYKLIFVNKGFDDANNKQIISAEVQ